MLRNTFYYYSLSDDSASSLSKLFFSGLVVSILDNDTLD